MVGAWMKLLKGEEHDSEAFEAGFREMFKDIARYLENEKTSHFFNVNVEGKGPGLGETGRSQGFYSRPA